MQKTTPFINMQYNPPDLECEMSDKPRDNITITLCDLVHNWVGAGTYMFH